MRLSLILPRRDRPFANWCELMSLVRQRLSRDQYEILVLDDSTTTDTPKIYKEFQRHLPIRFFHFHGWRSGATCYVGPDQVKSLSFHFNYGLRHAQGDIVLIEAGEMVHLAPLEEMIDPHMNHTGLLCHGGVKDIREEGLRTHNWATHPESLWERPDIWGELLVPPSREGALELNGFLYLSLRRALALRVGGFDEAFAQDGFDCEDEEFTRRLQRSGCETRSLARIMAGHVSHDKREWTSTPALYRYRLANRVKKDQGYWEPEWRAPYYRPGTEKRPITANAGYSWGSVPRGVDVWTLGETIERL